MKKLIIASALLSTITSQAFIHYNKDNVRWDAGARLAVAAISGNYGYEPRNTPALQSESISTNGTSFQGGLFGEFLYSDCGVWTGGFLVDVFGDTLNRNVQTYFQNGGPTASAHIKAPIHGGFDIRGGRNFGDSLWYVLLGVEGAKFKLNIANNTAAMIRGIPANSSTDYNFGKAGLRVGTGIEIGLSECWNLKLEYRAVFFGKHSFSLTDTTTTPSVIYDRTIKLNQHSAALMFSYVF